MKLTKIKYKEKKIKPREKKQITYKGIPIRLSADFSADTLQVRKKVQDIFKEMKEKKNHNQEYSAYQGSHSNLTEESKALETSIS